MAMTMSSGCEASGSPSRAESQSVWTKEMGGDTWNEIVSHNKKYSCGLSLRPL